jgi:hypothetical protein
MFKKKLKIGDIVQINFYDTWEDIIFIKHGRDGSIVCVEQSHSNRFKLGNAFNTIKITKDNWRNK